ncbi:MAG: 4Fe-4S dicluster domain-containing protein [Desulfovibrio sp.]|nr:4Fe-4S dicluster domain-containing protein [Desulfovibrio sp.]
MRHIETLDGHKRMSTQALLQTLEAAIEEGETDFYIHASGQHDIGGPFWNRQGKKLHFFLTNPGQRVGAMALPETEIVVQGSVPADCGWLNAGGEITILGDAGDTAGHCAAQGQIYIAGHAGTRSGSLMKKDPSYPAPELWILQSVGSFAFEFMSGGCAVVCGVDCEGPVLGQRPCVGMVEGVVYVRGRLPEDAQLHRENLNEEDKRFLGEGLERFLGKIGQMALLPDLTDWRNWQKILPAVHRPKATLSLADYRRTRWIQEGLFSDVLPDTFQSVGLAAKGQFRLRIPVWDNTSELRHCRDCHKCELTCPQKAIVRKERSDGSAVYASLDKACLGCGLCQSVCPEDIWRMENNAELQAFSSLDQEEPSAPSCADASSAEG